MEVKRGGLMDRSRWRQILSQGPRYQVLGEATHDKQRKLGSLTGTQSSTPKPEAASFPRGGCVLHLATRKEHTHDMEWRIWEGPGKKMR